MAGLMSLPALVLLFTVLQPFISVVTPSRSQCFDDVQTSLNTPSSTPNVVGRLLDGYSQFAFDLLREADGSVTNATQQQPAPLASSRDEKNVFMSPVSVWSALLVTFLGARGSTRTEIGAVLRVPGVPQLGVAKAYRFLKTWYHLRAAPEPGANFTFRMANRVFLQKGQAPRTCLLPFLSDDLAAADFAGRPDESRRGINAWVADQTEGKIRDLLPGGSVSSETSAVLVNAAYFKGDWSTKFDAKLTQRARFNGALWVQMMRMESDFRYVRSVQQQCEMLELPYADGQLSMFVLLPVLTAPSGTSDAGRALDALVRRLSVQSFQQLEEESSLHSVAVSLPKFKLDESLELREELGALGVRLLFDSRLGDLSGFSGSSFQPRVGSVLHQARLEVGEEGTEASAATAVLAFRDGMQQVQPKKRFVADRPFLFLIRDNLLDTVLFVGTLRRPADAEDAGTMGVPTRRPLEDEDDKKKDARVLKKKKKKSSRG